MFCVNFCILVLLAGYVCEDALYSFVTVIPCLQVVGMVIVWNLQDYIHYVNSHADDVLWTHTQP